jgi:hypothetical protein
MKKGVLFQPYLIRTLQTTEWCCIVYTTGHLEILIRYSIYMYDLYGWEGKEGGRAEIYAPLFREKRSHDLTICMTLCSLYKNDTERS